MVQRQISSLRSKILALSVICALSAPACTTVEEYLPMLVIAGGAAASVLALNYYDDPEYALAAIGVIGSLTPIAYSAAGSYIDLRRRQREIEELENIETEIRAEYEATLAPSPQGQAAPQWGTADAASGTTAPQWGHASEPPQPAGVAPTAPSAGSPWGDRYPQPGTAARDADVALALDVAILKKTASGPEALADNAIVYDGDSDPYPADALQVFFRPTTDAFVYVVAIDSVGRVQSLYPTSLPSAAVPAGTNVRLPAANEWYGLDHYAGLEHVYLYASSTPNAELEAKLTPIVGRPTPNVVGQVHAVSERSVLETPYVTTRGLTNVRPIELADIAGAAAPLEVTRYVAPPPGTGVMATRVLEHR